MRVSLRFAALLAILIGSVVSSASADTTCPQSSPPEQRWDSAIRSSNFENEPALASDLPLWEGATGEIYRLPNDIPGLIDRRADSEAADLPTLHAMPKREFVSGAAGGDPINVPEPPNMLLLACGLTSVLLVRSRISPR
jgi:hypothetical protein